MSSNETGKAIQQLREAKGLTQEALAEKIGVSQQSVAKWEAGQALPRSKVVSILERELGAKDGQILQLRGAEKTIFDSAPPGSIWSKGYQVAQGSFESIGFHKTPNQYAEVIRKQVEEAMPGSHALWNSVVKGNATSWSVDFMADHVVAQFLTPGTTDFLKDSIANHAAKKLWSLVTLRTYLRDTRAYVLIVAVPNDGGYDQRLHQLLHRVIAEAALMDVFVFLVNAPEQAAAILDGKFNLQGDAPDDDGIDRLS